MLDYIEILWRGGCISFDTDAPDGTVDNCMIYSIRTVKDCIQEAIEKNRNTVILVKIRTHGRKD